MENSLQVIEMDQIREGGAWSKVVEVEDRVNGVKRHFRGRNGRTG